MRKKHRTGGKSVEEKLAMEVMGYINTKAKQKGIEPLTLGEVKLMSKVKNCNDEATEEVYATVKKGVLYVAYFIEGMLITNVARYATLTV